MSATYKFCKNCENTQPGDSVYRCDRCNFFFCFNCIIEKNNFFYNSYHCPKCESKNHTIIGEIEDNDIENQDDSDMYYDIPVELARARRELREIRNQIYSKYNFTELELQQKRKVNDPIDLLMIFYDKERPMTERINSIFLVNKDHEEVAIFQYDLKGILQEESYPLDFRILAGELIDIKNNSSMRVDFRLMRDDSTVDNEIRKYVRAREDEAYFGNL